MAVTYQEYKDQRGQYSFDEQQAAEEFWADPGVREMMAYGPEQRKIYEAAQGRQRAAAARQRGVQRKRLGLRLDTGLRDIEKGRERGIEAAVNDALQRGIYRSGIRKENVAQVETDQDDAASDLRSQIDLALESLRAQGAGQEAAFDAQTAAQNASMAPTMADAQAWFEHSFEPTFTPGATPPGFFGEVDVQARQPQSATVTHPTAPVQPSQEDIVTAGGQYGQR